MNKVITFSDDKYFKYGKLFLRTRSKIDAHFIMYGSNLNTKQLSVLKNHNIEHRKAPKDFQDRMQFLKFEFLANEIDLTNNTYGITFIDFDTFFIKDWAEIFNKDFALGITIRNDLVKKRMFRAFANGGVIFTQNTQESLNMCNYALDIMLKGGDKSIKEYDFIYKTLEIGRAPHKTYKRDNLRWWVDQVFLSSVLLRYFNKHEGIKDHIFFNFNEFKVGAFNCTKYNHLDPSPEKVKQLMKTKQAFIIHLKNKGREIIKNIERVVA